MKKSSGFTLIIAVIVVGVMVILSIKSIQKELVKPVEGSAKIETVTRELSGVTDVRYDLEGDLTIKQGDVESITIESDDNLLPLIQSNVETGTLSLEVMNGRTIVPSDSIHITLTVKEIDTLTSTATGSITILDLSADDFTYESYSSGSATVSGQVDSLDLNLFSSGSFYGSDLIVKTAKVESSSSGSADLNVTDELTATLSGSGNVTCTGSPKVNLEANGTGTVITK